LADPHKYGYPSAVGQVQHRESSLVKDQHSTTVPRNIGLSTDTMIMDTLNGS